MYIVFLLEESSTKYLLDILLPRILPEDVMYITIPHDGKSDLKASIPKKLKAWNVPDTKFVIIQDQDSNDCVQLKKDIKALCYSTNKKPLIRIACHEMEAWYFGDLAAVSKAYNKDFTGLSQKRKYRNPDSIINPKKELRKLIPEHEQIAGAKRIGPYMDINNNSSHSFNVLVDGIRTLIKA